MVRECLIGADPLLVFYRFVSPDGVAFFDARTLAIVCHLLIRISSASTLANRVPQLNLWDLLLFIYSSKKSESSIREDTGPGTGLSPKHVF